MRRTEFIVGLVILLGIAAAFFGTVWLKGARLGQAEMEVEARFVEVGQLLEGNAVKLRGVPIGRVEDIALEPGGGGVIVTMRIQSEVPLPADPVVILSPESMFGDWQAEIHPRSRFAQYQYAEAPDPQVLPGYSLTERVDLAFTEETALNIRRAIENIEDVSSQLTGLVTRQSDAAENLAGSLEQTSATVNETVLAIRELVRQVEQATSQGEIGAIVENVANATEELDELSRTMLAMSGDLRSTTAAADTAFGSLNQILATVERGDGTLGRLVQDTALYSELVQTNAALQALLEDVRQNPRKYINLQIF